MIVLLLSLVFFGEKFVMKCNVSKEIIFLYLINRIIVLFVNKYDLWKL